MDNETHQLEPDPATMHLMIERAAAAVVDHVARLPQQPAADVTRGAQVARENREDIPESGTPYQELIDQVMSLSATTFNSAGPGYLAYIPGGGLYHSAVAAYIAEGINRYIGVWQAAPGLVQLEANVIAWFCRMIGYPEEAGGFLTSGGSLANFSAVVTARRTMLPEEFLDGMVYTSDQAHHSVQKAALLAGFPTRNIRSIPSDSLFRIDLSQLCRAIGHDRDNGRIPFLVIGSAGTTNTGAVDDLTALYQIAREENCWFHVDAAYGGFFALTERGRAAMPGLALADSVTLDPHKGLFLPYGNGSLLVRNPTLLRQAHSVAADYMPTIQDDERLVDFCEISPELSRGFRGLRAWLPLRMHGVAPFREALDEKLDLINWIRGKISAIPEIEIVAEPQLTVLAFRLKCQGAELAEANEINRRFIDLINSRQRVFLTGTMLDGKFVLRICVLNFRTHLDRMQMALDDITAALAELTGERNGR